MAKRSHQLTSKTVQSLGPGRWSDGGNLYLSVSPSGARRWAFIYRAPGGRQREMGLGSAGKFGVSLAIARQLATEARQLLHLGHDPLDFRRKVEADARMPTFGEFADAYVDEHEAGWKNDKHVAQWRMTLTKLAAPLRNVRICDITVDHVLAALKPIWLATPETARRTRARIETVLDAAKAKGLRDGDNPARWRGHLDKLLPRSKKSEAHFAAMDYAAAPAFVRRLRESGTTAAQAFELLILTAVRTNELLEAHPGEFDLEERLWTIPAERMKMGRVHRVPLSPRAVALVQAAKARLKPQDVYLFPGQKKGHPYSNMVFTTLMKRMAVEDATPHGFRSAFRDWSRVVNQTPNDVTELSLAHIVGSKTERAYARSDLLDERRVVMGRWAEYLGGGAAPTGGTST